MNDVDDRQYVDWLRLCFPPHLSLSGFLFIIRKITFKIMLKPKNHNFRLKVLLSKLEAVSNKVASRCHAFLRVDNDELSFKVTPELKKNVATFNAEVQSENFCIQFDEVTGLYEGKSATVMFELETQGTRVKIGEVQLNLGAILNEKKYRIVNSFPLAKCYDKTAKAKISVDFVPLSAPAEQAFSSQRKEKRQVVIRQGSLRETPSQGQVLGVSPSGGWKQTAYKSRLAEESNYILQQKIYEYEQKMDNYRLSQTQLQEKLHQQISNKDDHIAELTGELARKTNQISALTLQGEQLRFRLKEMGDEVAASKEANRSLMAMVQGLQHEEEDLKKQVQSLRASLDNQGRTKENKQKHFTQELAKYTQRYLESEQERNKIVFQLESKFKQEIQKKQINYRALIANNDKKHTDTINSLKLRVKELETQLVERAQVIEKQVHQAKKLNEQLNQRVKQLSDTHKQLQSTIQERDTAQKNHSHLSHELQTLTFSYHQLERQKGQLHQEAQAGRRASQQLRMQLLMANQTIQEQRKILTKYGKELQVHQQRAYYLTEKYNDEMEMKSQEQDHIRGETQYYKEEMHKLRNQLIIAEEHAEEQANANHQMQQALHRIELQLSNKNQALVRSGEQKIMLQTENRSLRSELGELQQAIMLLKEENMQLNDYLRQKKAALQSDKTLEWSYKIEELQLDISEMVEKFKVEKDLLRDTFKKEELKRKEEISNLTALLRKAKEDNEELRRSISRRQAHFKDHDQTNQELRFALKERTDELSEYKEKMRIYMAEVEELESRLREREQRQSTKLKEAQEKYQKQAKWAKKADALKTSFNKVITYLLQFISKPFSASVIYQEVLSPDLDPQISNMINLSLKKFCEERTKTKETIKRLQSQSFFKTEKTIEKESRFVEKRISTELIIEPTKRNYFKEAPQLDSPWKYQQSSRPKDTFQSDSYREENARLKREISQLRVKVKSLQDDVVKAERNGDSERYSREALKHQMEDLQDELQKVSFQLKRKEKLIAEYETEMKEMQTEILTTKSIQASTTPKQSAPASRLQIRQREKEENVQSSRNAAIIRDLQARLEQRNKQNEELATQISRLKGENNSLGEVINNLRSQIKVNETKLKEKTTKSASLEQQLIGLKASLEQEFQRDILKQQKRIADLEEEASGLDEECRRAQQTISSLEKELAQAERRVKIAKEESRINEGKLKREGEQAQARLKETIQQLQHSVLTLTSQTEQLALKNKELTNRISSLTTLLAKKGEQIDKHQAALNSKSSQVIQLQEIAEENRREYEGKLAQLLQRLQELQTALQQKDYELQEYRFTSQGKLMDLQKRLQQTMQVVTRQT